MADRKNWLSRINPFGKADTELKALREQLDNVVGEYRDQSDYDTKFLDVEPSAFNSHYTSDLSGIDQQVDTAALQRIYQSETWVYTAVTAIAKTVAGLPVKLEKKKVIKKKVHNHITGTTDEVETEIWIDASGEKLFKRFAYPNPFTTKTEFFMLLMIDLLTAGEYYVYLDSDQDLTTLADDMGEDEDVAPGPFSRLREAMASDSPVKAMYRVPPALMKPVPAPDHQSIAGYLMQSDKGVFSYSYDEIIHVKLPNPNNPFQGLAPLVATIKPVLLDRYSTEHMVRFYKSGARLGGAITTEKSLNKEQLSRFQRSFEQQYTGRANHHRTLILPPGMKYAQIAQNPAETALIEFCKYNREAILATFNVPPIKVGVMDHANYANALVQLKIFFEDTVKPYLCFIEDGFSLKQTVIPQQGLYRFKFDLSDIEALKDNFKDQAEAAKFMVDAGLTINEIRERVWNAGPIPDGDKCKAIEDIKNKKPSNDGGLFLAAPKENVDTKTQLPNAQEDSALIDPTKPTKVTFSQRVQQLVAAFVQGGMSLELAIPKAIAQARLEGFTDPDDNGPDSGAGKPAEEQSDDKLGTSENAEIVPRAVGTALLVKPEDLEDDEDKDKDKKDEKPTLAEFIAEAVQKLDDAEEITPDFIGKLVAMYHEQYGTPDGASVDGKEVEQSAETATPDAGVATGQDQIVETKPREYALGLKKEQIVEHWKTFISKTDPLVERRVTEVRKYFKAYKEHVLKKLGANLKAYGLHKARDNEDIDDITSLEGLDAAIKGFVKDVDKTLTEAYQQGYGDTLPKFDFGKAPSEEAVKHMEEYAAEDVTYINETTRDQMRELLTDSFKEGKSIGEISKDIQDKFDEIDNGRAITIARTEALSAVSAGREAKRAEVQKQFPERKLKIMWVAAQDNRVRDTHDEYDGTSIEYNGDEEFAPGLGYPRDENCDDPAEVINCRCTDMTYDEEDEADVQDLLPTDEEDTGDEAPAADENADQSTDEEDDTPDDEKDKDKSFTGNRTTGGPGKGGAGSGRKPGSIKPYERKPSQKPIAPARATIAAKDNQLVEDRFKKPGADVTHEDASAFTFAMVPAAKEVQADLTKTVAGLQAAGIPAALDKVRVKEVDSLQAKMNDKWDNKPLNQVTDGVGARIVVSDLHAVDNTVARFPNLSGLKVIEHDDMTTNSKDGGYRAVHLLVKTSDGKTAEVQIKTENQNTFSKWSHPNVYKNDSAPTLRDNKEVRAYTQKVSDMLHQADLGKGLPADRPQPPKAMTDAKIPAFPWDKVHT